MRKFFLIITDTFPRIKCCLLQISFLSASSVVYLLQINDAASCLCYLYKSISSCQLSLLSFTYQTCCCKMLCYLLHINRIATSWVGYLILKTNLFPVSWRECLLQKKPSCYPLSWLPVVTDQPLSCQLTWLFVTKKPSCYQLKLATCCYRPTSFMSADLNVCY